MRIKQKKIIIVCIAVLLLVGIEQVVKFQIPKEGTIVLIQNFLNITYVENTGAAFGIGANNTANFIIINLIVLGLVVRFLITQIERMNIWTKIPLALILAGGIGNLLDRIFRGYVIDFIDINAWIHFPVFNLADIYITFGWVLFVIITIVHYVKNEKKGKT